jgi:hypothetical protein
MKRIYDAGHEQALDGTAWTSAVEEQSLWRGLFKKQVPATLGRHGPDHPR